MAPVDGWYEDGEGGGLEISNDKRSVNSGIILGPTFS